MYPARPTLLAILGFSSLAILSGLTVSSLSVTHASPQAPTGKEQFISRCAACHGEDGHGGQLAPNIVAVANPRATSVDANHRLIRPGIPPPAPPSAPAPPPPASPPPPRPPPPKSTPSPPT